MHALNLYQQRRTQYALNDQLPLPRAALETLIKSVVREAPSAFNSQSSRVVILFGDEHQKFWNQLVKDALRPLTPAEQFVNTEKKMASFAAGAGTILFFEDQDVIRGLQEKFALYADKFPEFSANAAGMAQFAVWTALAEAGIGASLQHYNPVIDAQVHSAWNLPASWQLSAQMPFGGNAAEFADKDYMDDAQRFRVFG
ncbi:MAG: nitroreductase family protein [Thiopseudomonas sp.]|nr:nitroreductase family protein [Thiopseudomonas sp.]